MSMIRIFMPMSGNVGDTLNVMPVLSGIYKSTGHSISLVVRDKMKQFNGFRDFMLMQDCISSLKFESDVIIDDTYNYMSLVDDFTPHPNRPHETVRLEEYFRRRYNIEFEVDDSFIFNTPKPDKNIEEFIVGDRAQLSDMDMRRSFNVLKSSGKFPIEKCYFLDYNTPMAMNAAYIQASDKPVFTTFTGISTITDLLNKRSLVVWGDDLKDWDNKPISYSYFKHFYRDRKAKLIYLGEFDFSYYEVTHEV